MKPPNAPLLMTRMTSPGRAPSTTTRDQAVDVGVGARVDPSSPEVGDHPLRVKPLVGGHHVVGLRHLQGDAGRRRRKRLHVLCLVHAPAARVRPGLERRHSRRPGNRARIAAIVSRTAVGWWAKSSMTTTPPASPRTSCRRRTPAKRGEAGAISSNVEPQRARRRHDAQRVLDVVGAAAGQRRGRRARRPRSSTVKRTPSGPCARSRATVVRRSPSAGP